MPLALHLMQFPYLSRNPNIEQVGRITATDVQLDYIVTVVKPNNPKRRVPGQWKGGWVGRVAHSTVPDGMNNPGWDIHLKYVPADNMAEDAGLDVGESENLIVTVIPPSGDVVSGPTSVNTVP